MSSFFSACVSCIMPIKQQGQGQGHGYSSPRSFNTSPIRISPIITHKESGTQTDLAQSWKLLPSISGGCREAALSSHLIESSQPSPNQRLTGSTDDRSNPLVSLEELFTAKCVSDERPTASSIHSYAPHLHSEESSRPSRGPCITLSGLRDRLRQARILSGGEGPEGPNILAPSEMVVVGSQSTPLIMSKDTYQRSSLKANFAPFSNLEDSTQDPPDQPPRSSPKLPHSPTVTPRLHFSQSGSRAGMNSQEVSSLLSSIKLRRREMEERTATDESKRQADLGKSVGGSCGSSNHPMVRASSLRSLKSKSLSLTQAATILPGVIEEMEGGESARGAAQGSGRVRGSSKMAFDGAAS